MATLAETAAERLAPDGEPEAKRQRIDNASDEAEEVGEGSGIKRVKRKFAIVLGYLGFKYRGLMINYEIEATFKIKSVEHIVREAMVRAGLVTALNAERLEQKMGWSRSSRTDAGVSAMRLIISARFLVLEDTVDGCGRCQALVNDLNQELPDDIRCFGAIKVPRSFDAKRSCSWREYEYLLPVEMVQPSQKIGGGDSAAKEQISSADHIERFRRALGFFKGCHSFHNFCRLKASDLRNKIEIAESQGKGGSKKGGKGKKGKGGKGGKKGKGQKGKDAEAPEPESDEEEGEREEEADVSTAPPDAAAADTTTKAAQQPAASGEGPAKPEIVPIWVDILAKDTTTGALRERPAQVLKHTATSIWLCAVEPTLEGKCLRVRLRGQFFLYNQIRLMIGTAAAVARGTLPEELLDLALKSPVELHLPLAPATGLFQRTSGFSMLDGRAGFAAMDAEQASLCMLPEGGFVLIDEAGAAAAEAFTLRVESEVFRIWREGSETEAWLRKLDAVHIPQEAVLAELRARLAKAASQEAEARKGQAEAEIRRRQEKLTDGITFSGMMPKRFCAGLMARFGLVPSWRVTNIQHAVAQRLRRWEEAPDERPSSISSPPETEELLDFIAAIGVDILAKEGADDI